SHPLDKGPKIAISAARNCDNCSQHKSQSSKYPE
ncbi:MAG: hypothetical protein ACI94O_001923, partial [Octadecabacter sp.]